MLYRLGRQEGIYFKFGEQRATEISPQSVPS